ncbi:MAG: PEP-CTERM sorting domain-containing protein [Planctomycetota bacterium]
MFFPRLAAAAALLLAAASPADAAFLTESQLLTQFGFNSSTPGSISAAWDSFSTPVAGPNFADVGSSGFTGAQPTVTQNIPGAFITSGGNIYSFQVATDFDVAVPTGVLSGDTTTFIAQIRTLGTEIAPASLLLGALGAAPVAPASITEIARTPLGGFGGELVNQLIVWNVSGPVSAGSPAFGLEFNAAGSSMSLDSLQINAFASTAAVPEPGTLLLTGIGAVGAVLVRRRKTH